MGFGDSLEKLAQLEDQSWFYWMVSFMFFSYVNSSSFGIYIVCIVISQNNYFRKSKINHSHVKWWLDVIFIEWFKGIDEMQNSPIREGLREW